jgi:hypothetical protein
MPVLQLPLLGPPTALTAARLPFQAPPTGNIENAALGRPRREAGDSEFGRKSQS